MTTIAAGSSPFDVNSLKKLNLLGSAAVRKLTPEEIEKFHKIHEQIYTRPTDLKDHFTKKAYAEVQVDGKVVATLYNSGAAETGNATASKIMGLPSMGEKETAVGPELAQKRADEIAKALGGTVVKADTAVTQALYLASTSRTSKPDPAAMAAAEGRVATPQTQVDTQVIAQQSGDDSSLGKSISGSPEDEFLAFANKSWEERIRALILKSMGIKEEDLVKMSPEERAAIEAKIKEKIKAEVEKKTGISLTQAL